MAVDTFIYIKTSTEASDSDPMGAVQDNQKGFCGGFKKISSQFEQHGTTEGVKVFALAAVVVATVAFPGFHPPAPTYAPAKYDFNYAVNDPPSGNDFGHQEARDGDNTQGSYYVQLPDGRLQRVTYTVNGDSGYVADVTYEGEAHYPNPKASHGPPHPSY
ncbi:cuticle protein 7-like [Penaeus japonicus]|uniref:cuticle protein 7-like n=1 Tax=Penaeus japonicus TaxID=27405 RepID=UPI001C712885|nr:cuticle protein 7-like [Penaeus japonicus]